MNPTETTVAAMPGTLAELSERTGYPVSQVLKHITLARRDGVRVNAEMQPRPLGEAPGATIFRVDSPAREE